MLVCAMAAQVRLRVWRRVANEAQQQELLCDLSSKRGAVEVGGGPWWSTWSAQVRVTDTAVVPTHDTTQMPMHDMTQVHTHV